MCPRQVGKTPVRVRGVRVACSSLGVTSQRGDTGGAAAASWQKSAELASGRTISGVVYLRERHPHLLHDAKVREHFHRGLFRGFDFDNTMLRIGSMNMLLHGVENPDIRYRDSLAQEHGGEEEKYTLVLANPPFAGSLDYENTAKDLLQIIKTKKAELLFLVLFLRLLKRLPTPSSKATSAT